MFEFMCLFKYSKKYIEQSENKPKLLNSANKSQNYQDFSFFHIILRITMR